MSWWPTLEWPDERQSAIAPEEATFRARRVHNDARMAAAHHNPGLACVLSLILPGVGQFYNGEFLRGLFWIIITPGLWIGTGGTLGWVCHVISAITAYRRAALKNYESAR